MKNNTIKALSIGVAGCLLVMNLNTSAQIKDLSKEMELINETHQIEIERFENLNENNKNLKEEIKELKKNRWIYKGDYEVTGYCNCPICCGKWSGGPTFSGTKPTAGRTIATDPSVIPIGSKVIIDNHVYVAEDTGSAIKGKKIDIFFETHEEAKKFGKQSKEVYF